jgi:hypothetical protein
MKGILNNSTPIVVYFNDCIKEGILDNSCFHDLATMDFRLNKHCHFGFSNYEVGFDEWDYFVKSIKTLESSDLFYLIKENDSQIVLRAGNGVLSFYHTEYPDQYSKIK